MTAADILGVFDAAGITLRATPEGNVRFDRTPGPDLLAELRANKAAILSLLRNCTPEGDYIDFAAIEALRSLHAVPLPDDSQSRPGLRPLTEVEKRQIRTGGAPLPAGVSYGRTATGQWRRLT